MQLETKVENPGFKLPFSRWRFIDLVYPPFCCNCGKIGFEICPECFSNIEIIPIKRSCKVCGDILKANTNCNKCIQLHTSIDQARSWGFYSGALKRAIIKIKYKRGFGLIEYLTQPLIQLIKEWDIPFEMIIPIPLGKKREKDRGYNQSALIAEPIADFFNIPLREHALVRTRDTKTQVGLSFEERKENMKNAFRVVNSMCENKSILLIDDIATTFSTINESAKALKDSGAKKIFCFTVARAKNRII